MDKYTISFVIRVLTFFGAAVLAFIGVGSNNLLWIAVVAVFAALITFIIGEMILMQVFKGKKVLAFILPTVTDVGISLLVAYVFSLLTSHFDFTDSVTKAAPMVDFGLLTLIIGICIHGVLLHEAEKKKRY